MPTFLDLSNELLYRIVKTVPRDDLPSLSLTNKLLHALSDKDCKRHLALKKYSTLSFGNYYTSGYVHHSPKTKLREDTKDGLLFLASIIKDSRISEYPQRICVGSCADYEIRPSWLNVEYQDKRQSIITELSAQVKTAVEKCDFISEENKEQASIAILDPQYEGLAVSLVVTMLPQLRSIVTQDWSYGAASGRLCASIVKIAEANLDPKSPNHNKALSQLQEFSMTHTEAEGGEPISRYAPYAMLPSMRILSGTQIAGEGRFEWPPSFQPGSSNVTEIDIRCSAVDARAFESLLSGISALRRFTYHHHGANVGFAQYSAAGYVSSLRRHHTSSLQLLDISLEDINQLMEEEEELQGVGSLQMFTSLEEVRLQHEAFQISGPDDGLNGEALEGGRFYSEEGEEEETTESMHRLVDFLPASIKSLTIINHTATKEVQDLFRGTVEEVSEKLPVFKAVTFKGDDPLDDAMKEALTHAGLTLKRWTYDCGSSPIDV
ncbi:MAG: hypothetical protein HETSPECPRED_005791 [Heterodermia speciosa]|uniref:F-box domain-containing protein n=1 Tax=Heterodermia speciosa TaxID=116794 RepID=A0A8H3FQA5_9LECA|nr:MAG: hypothetical protein HETSPECPRED_005791 [Heterodermia speciosa]